MLSNDELDAIQDRMKDNYFKWHILTAQHDLKRLLVEVKRLRAEREQTPAAETLAPKATTSTECGSRSEGSQPSSHDNQSS